MEGGGFIIPPPNPISAHPVTQKTRITAIAFEIVLSFIVITIPS
jgi:hypothetical protein